MHTGAPGQSERADASPDQARETREGRTPVLGCAWTLRQIRRDGKVEATVTVGLTDKKEVIRQQRLSLCVCGGVGPRLPELPNNSGYWGGRRKWFFQSCISDVILGSVA